MLCVGFEPVRVCSVWKIKLTFVVAHGYSPVTGETGATFAVRRKCLAGPTGGIHNVIRAGRLPHVLRIANLKRKDDAGAFTLRTGKYT